MKHDQDEPISLRELLQSVLEELGAIRVAVERQRPDSALLSPADLAERLGVDERTIRRMKGTGELPAPRLVRGKPRWRWTDVEAFVAKKAKRRA